MNTNTIRSKHSLGLIYGLVSGGAFAIFAWGMDAWMLSLANTTYAWTRFLPGLLICLAAGGLVGYLTIYYESHIKAFVMWFILGAVFSWLVVWLPLTGGPYLVSLLDPDLAARFDFAPVADLYQFRLVSLIICAAAAIFSGLLQINLIKQALFSSYSSASAMILLVCLVLFGVAGSATDHLINTNFREPIQAVDNLIQFAADHQGQEVPVEVARKIHLTAVRQVTDHIQSQRQLTLIAYDSPLGMMDILVDLEGILVQCTAIYSQPTNCILLSETP